MLPKLHVLVDTCLSIFNTYTFILTLSTEIIAFSQKHVELKFLFSCFHFIQMKYIVLLLGYEIFKRMENANQSKHNQCVYMKTSKVKRKSYKNICVQFSESKMKIKCGKSVII